MLPVIDNRLINQIKLPESKKCFNIKPYNTAQEKILLQAITDKGDRKGWLTNSLAIIEQNSLEKIDFPSLSVLDLLYICIKMRSISKSEVFEYSFPCDGEKKTIDEEGKETLVPCKHIFREKDTMDTLLVIKNSDTTKVICDVSKNLSLELTNPKLDYLEFLADIPTPEYTDDMGIDVEDIAAKQNLELFCNQISFCVSKVFVKDNTGKPKIYHEFTPSEVKEKVILNLTLDELEKLHTAKKELINGVIRLRKVCPECGKVHEKEESNFFAYVA